MNTTKLELTPEADPLENMIRQRAYFLWLETGSPHGGDWEHWFAAKQQILREMDSMFAEVPAGREGASAHFSIRRTLAGHQRDPAHRFHAPGKAHDDRLYVVAGEARQRVRGRHSDRSLRSPQKKAE